MGISVSWKPASISFSPKAVVNAWMRNLKGRKSVLWSSFSIFLAMSVW
jgi:hypothetical protein